MMLGKRPRHSIKRTTSMTEFSLDLSSTTLVNGGQQQQPLNPFVGGGGGGVGGGYDGIIDQRLLAAAIGSPRNHRRNSLDSETPHFLRSCALCKRRLVPGRDIYMYRGDGAFCSSECRQQQMNQDERKDKCSLASKKEASPPSSAKSETIAAI